ncbi:MAG: hypothetical protein JNK90_23535 [Planctomycetaceae bacterium]|nr:hypothetical protein [Planctomycetaceae bacterium]
MEDYALFPLHEDLTPDPNRIEPSVWIRRLYILGDPNTDSLIREIPFERGLNIIRTEERGDLEENVVAHSVGKTLLMRLIRYTLGEPNYASEESQAELAKLLPNGLVVAHWRVDGEDWLVRRPLHDHEPNSAYCIHWQRETETSSSPTLNHATARAILAACMDAKDNDRVPFKSFLKTLDSVIAKELPRLELTKDRIPHWEDLVGWFTRDCECGYRQANEWRHPDVIAGQTGDLNQNKLMMQWLCGLMSADEAELRNQHRQLLAEQRKAKAAAEKHSRTASLKEESLRDSMDRPKTSDSSANKDKTDLFEENKEPSVTEKAESMLQNSIELLDELKAKSPVPALEKHATAIQAKLDQANTAAAELKGELTAAIKYQRDLKAADRNHSLLKHCNETPCGLRNYFDRARELGRDETIDDKLVETDQAVRQLSDQEKEAIETSKALHDELKQAQQAIEAARHKQADSERLLIEQIGRWKQHVVDAKRFDAVAKEASTHDSAVTNLAKAIDDSSARQETARKTLEHTKRVANASAAYTQVLQRVFNEAATGSIQVDGFGLQPKPAKQLTPGGRALSAMATVVSFDLACVMLSIAGVGNHPRFLIHDSPREGEMEMPLFKRIFDVACYLESCFGNSLPSFQYIVTTTKAPPSYCNENEPHTCVVLHARDEEGRLLKMRF